MEQDPLPSSEESNPNNNSNQVREGNDKEEGQSSNPVKEHSQDVDPNSKSEAALRSNLVKVFNRNPEKEVSNREVDPDSNQAEEDNSKEVVLKNSPEDNNSSSSLRKMFSNSMPEARPKRQQHRSPEEEDNSNKAEVANSNKLEDGNQLPVEHRNSKEEDLRNKVVGEPSNKQVEHNNNNNQEEELNSSNNNLAEELSLANLVEEAGKRKRSSTLFSTMQPFRSLVKPAATFQSFWRIPSPTTTKLIL